MRAADRHATPLPGDDLLPDAALTTTHQAIVEGPPEGVWPWLAQMGWGRAGFYAIDRLDNGGVPSATRIHPELTGIAAGDRMPADRRGGAFEVLVADAPHALVLGGLVDPRDRLLRPFSTPRPERFWHLTWAFALDPATGDRTRVLARVRIAGSARVRLHAPWIRGGHGLMQRVQLRNLARRVEGAARSRGGP